MADQTLVFLGAKPWGKLISLNFNYPNIDLDTTEVWLGRGASTHYLSRYQNLQISKQHCRFFIEEVDGVNKAFVEDHSTNGTYVNGTLIPLKKDSVAVIALNNGDEVCLAKPSFDHPEANDGMNLVLLIDISETVSYKFLSLVHQWEGEDDAIPPPYIKGRSDTNANSNQIQVRDSASVLEELKQYDKSEEEAPPSITPSITDAITPLRVGTRPRANTEPAQPFDFSVPAFLDVLNDPATSPENLLHILKELRNTVENLDNDQWIMQFMENGGMTVIVDLLASHNDISNSQSQYHNEEAVAEVQLALVRCIEEILNCEYGLDTLGDTEAEEPVRILGEVAIALDSPNPKLKSKVAKLLAAVCCVDENKHRLVLKALDYFKQQKNERRRFQKLVKSLTTVDLISYKVNAMSLINAVVNMPEALQERIQLRQELLDWDLASMLIILRVEDSEELNTQLDVFQEEMEQDDAQLRSKGLNLSNPAKIIEELKKQATAAESFSSLVELLHQLFSIPPDSKGKQVWRTISELVKGVVSSAADGNPSDVVVTTKANADHQLKEAMEVELQTRQQQLEDQFEQKMNKLKKRNQKEKEILRKKFDADLDNQARKHFEQITQLQYKVETLTKEINLLKSDLYTAKQQPQRDSDKTISKSEFTDKEIESCVVKHLVIQKLNTSLKSELELGSLYRPALEELSVAQNSKSKIFGEPLDTFVKRTGQDIPFFFQNIGNVIEVKATSQHLEGLFRVSSPPDQVKELKSTIENGKTDFQDSEDIYLLSSVMKAYVRELPEPVTTYHLFSSFAYVASIGEKSRLQAIKYLVMLLPKSHYDILKFLMMLLNSLSTRVEANRLTASQLAAAFGATLFRSKKAEISIEAYKQQKDINLITQVMIENAPSIFQTDQEILQELEKLKKENQYVALKNNVIEMLRIQQQRYLQENQPKSQPTSPRQAVVSAASVNPLSLSFANLPVSKSFIPPRVPMRTLLWNKLTDKHLLKMNVVHTACVWNQVNLEWVWSFLDFMELENLFFLRKRKSKVIVNPQQLQQSSSNSNNTEFVDVTRASTIEILLTHLKLTATQLKEALLKLDENILNADIVSQLLALAPNTEEKEILRHYKGEKSELGKAESFFSEMITIPRFKKRLKCFLVKLTFEEKLEDLKKNMDTVILACKEIETSQSFVRIIELILGVGNFLNHNSFKSPTMAFDLMFLAKLSEFKSTSSRSPYANLMDYIVGLIEKNTKQTAPANYVQLVDQLKHVPDASKVPSKQIEDGIQELKKSLLMVEEEIPRVNNPQDKFKNVMQTFLVKASEEFKQLEGVHMQMNQATKQLMMYLTQDPEKTSFEVQLSAISDFLINYGKSYKTPAKERKKERDPKEELKKDSKERRRKSGASSKRSSKVSPSGTSADIVPTPHSPTTSAKESNLPPLQVPPGYQERQNEKSKKRRSKSHVLDEISRTMKRGTAFRMRKSRQADDWLKNWQHEQNTQVGVISGALTFGQFPHVHK